MKKDLVGWLDGGLARVVGSGADCLCLSFLPLSGRSQLDCVMVLLRGCGKVIGSGSGVECFEGGSKVPVHRLLGVLLVSEGAERSADRV